jgi:hypothetical protein
VCDELNWQFNVAQRRTKPNTGRMAYNVYIQTLIREEHYGLMDKRTGAGLILHSEG